MGLRLADHDTPTLSSSSDNQEIMTHQMRSAGRTVPSVRPLSFAGRICDSIMMALAL